MTRGITCKTHPYLVCHILSTCIHTHTFCQHMGYGMKCGNTHKTYSCIECHIFDVHTYTNILSAYINTRALCHIHIYTRSVSCTYIHTHCVSIHNVAWKVASHTEQTRALHATCCQHTYIHTHTSCQHTYIQTCIHTYIQTHIHTYIHTCIRTYIYTYTYVLSTYTQTHSLSQHTEYDMKCSIAHKTYGVATVSRIDQIIGPFSRILSLL